MIILQWNTKSLIANGREFKGFIRDSRRTQEILGIQETWLKPMLDSVSGYDSVPRGRGEGNDICV